MWSGIYTLLMILVGVVILLVIVISALKDELCKVATALEESEKRSENLERTAFCALHNVEEAKKELSVIELTADVKSNVGRFQTHIAYCSLNGYLARAIALLTPAAYSKTHF